MYDGIHYDPLYLETFDVRHFAIYYSLPLYHGSFSCKRVVNKLEFAIMHGQFQKIYLSQVNTLPAS